MSAPLNDFVNFFSVKYSYILRLVLSVNSCSFQFKNIKSCMRYLCIFSEDVYVSTITIIIMYVKHFL